MKFHETLEKFIAEEDGYVLFISYNYRTIREVCNTYFRDFGTSVQQILSMKRDATNLKVYYIIVIKFE